MILPSSFLCCSMSLFEKRVKTSKEWSWGGSGRPWTHMQVWEKLVSYTLKLFLSFRSWICLNWLMTANIKLITFGYRIEKSLLKYYLHGKLWSICTFKNYVSIYLVFCGVLLGLFRLSWIFSSFSQNWFIGRYFKTKCFLYLNAFKSILIVFLSTES